MKSALRRPLMGLLCLLAVALLGSFVIWHWAEGQLEQGFADWTRAAAGVGWRVHAGATSRGGWPLAAALSVDDFSMTIRTYWRKTPIPTGEWTPLGVQKVN